MWNRQCRNKPRSVSHGPSGRRRGASSTTQLIFTTGNGSYCSLPILDASSIKPARLPDPLKTDKKLTSKNVVVALSQKIVRKRPAGGSKRCSFTMIVPTAKKKKEIFIKDVAFFFTRAMGTDGDKKRSCFWAFFFFFFSLLGDGLMAWWYRRVYIRRKKKRSKTNDRAAQHQQRCHRRETSSNWSTDVPRAR